MFGEFVGVVGNGRGVGVIVNISPESIELFGFNPQTYI